MSDAIEVAGEPRARPYAEVRRRGTPPRLRIPRLVGAAFGAALVAGPIIGATSQRAPTTVRVVRSIFWSSALGYLVTSLVDFAEHFRLEKEATGHPLRSTVVPLGETVNHAATIATIVSALALARPLRVRRLRALDAWLLAAPALFLALGWRDELVYHRKRSTHREDLMHTVSHLAAGVMWATLYAMRLPKWR